MEITTAKMAAMRATASVGPPSAVAAKISAFPPTGSATGRWTAAPALTRTPKCAPANSVLPTGSGKLLGTTWCVFSLPIYTYFIFNENCSFKFFLFMMYSLQVQKLHMHLRADEVRWPQGLLRWLRRRARPMQRFEIQRVSFIYILATSEMVCHVCTNMSRLEKNYTKIIIYMNKKMIWTKKITQIKKLHEQKNYANKNNYTRKKIHK